MSVQNVGKNYANGTTGAAAPTVATLVGGSDGTNLRALSVTSGGILNAQLPTVAHDAVLSVNSLSIGGYANNSTPTAVSAAGDMVHAWFDLNGRLSIWDGNGNLSIDDGGNSITVDGTVTSNAGTGFAAVATAGSAVPTTGYMEMGTDGTNARSISVDSSGRQIVIGAAAHDAVAAGNPLLMGAYASSATPTAVSAAGDAVNLWADLNGRLSVWDGNTTISIDDGAGSITVDGTVTANAGTGFATPATAGSAVSTTGYMAMGTDGTNARSLSVDSTGVLNTQLPFTASAGTNLTVSVTTSATSLLAASSTRKGWMIVNNDPVNDVWVGFTASVTEGTAGAAGANRGALLTAGGGSLNMSMFANYRGDIYAIGTTTVKIAVMSW